MSVTIGRTTFDRVDYDAQADVLYLHVGDPSTMVDFDESPEGHALRFDRDGRLVGMTIVGPRAMLDAGEPVVVTLATPERLDVDPAALAPIVRADPA